MFLAGRITVTSACLLFFFFIYLFLAVLGSSLLHAGFSCSEQGLLFIAVRGLLIAVASRGAQALGARASVVVVRRF